MKTKKIIHIGIVLSSVPGYSETFFRSKISGLLAEGFKVTLYVKNPKNAKGITCPVKVHPMLSKNSFLRLLQSIVIIFKLLFLAPKSTFRIVRISRAHGNSFGISLKAAIIGSTILPEKLDWLHFGFVTPALEREFVGRAIGAKVAVSFRGFDLNQKPLANNNIYLKFWPHVDKVHSISSYLIDRGFALGLKKETPFKIITPAIDARTFKRLSNEVKKKSILLVSRLHWIKGIEYVLHAVSELKKTIIDISVTIVGEGEDLERLIFATYQLDLLDQISFVGKQEHELVRNYMQSHEVFVQYSNQEGFCNAALEAQASGMLCVVSDAEGLQENVLDGRTGWVVPKRNPKALAAKLLEVINLSESEKEKVRQQARERVVQEFSLEKQRQEFVDFYTEDLK